MAKVKVGIIGSAGYTGGELLRLLINHPHINIEFAHSASNGGNKVWEVHQDLLGDTDLEFSPTFHSNIDVLFLCVGHGTAKDFLAQNPIAKRVKIIDLSQDFRLKEHSSYQGDRFVYGLPELNRSAIKKARYVANPGCFATNIQLALLPLAAHKLLPDQVQIQSTTGSTGAGQNPSATTHFSWRSSNLSVYQAFEHRHLQEISESLEQLQPGFLPHSGESLLERAAQKLNLIPQRGAFARGIFSAIHLKSPLKVDEAHTLYEEFYKTHPFTHLSPVPVDLKQVVNTNKNLLHISKHGENLLILSASDNLLKGASGQAVQNMNLMFGMDESTGLRLKGIGF